MILKLIQAGGFTGRSKTAEKDISGLPQAMQSHVETIFSQHTVQPAQARAQSAGRDREQYFLEYNGRTLPFHALQANKDLHTLLEQMKDDLHYHPGNT